MRRGVRPVYLRDRFKGAIVHLWLARVVAVSVHLRHRRARRCRGCGRETNPLLASKH
jgi:hypothetical protein